MYASLHARSRFSAPTLNYGRILWRKYYNALKEYALLVKFRYRLTSGWETQNPRIVKWKALLEPQHGVGEGWDQIAMYIHLLAIFEPLEMNTPTHRHMDEKRWGTSACFFNNTHRFLVVQGQTHINLVNHIHAEAARITFFRGEGYL